MPLTPERAAREPSRLLVEWMPKLPRGKALDLACGGGRNAVYLASRGFMTMGVDRDAEAIEAMKLRGLKRGLQVQGTVADMEKTPPEFEIPTEFYEIICVFRYLWRPLLPVIAKGLAPGGFLLYETFTTEQPRYGKPTNPEFLLKPGELREAFKELEILHYAEGVRDAIAGGQEAVASLVARKPTK